MMTIRIEDDIPLPQPDKVYTWITKSGEIVSRTKIDPPTRYPAETMQDSKRRPVVDCFLVGGPLNGQNGLIVGDDRTVELNIYADDGSVSSIELYTLGDKGDLGCRHYAGTKAVVKDRLDVLKGDMRHD